MKKIYSSLIGPLLQNEEFEDWWESKPIKIPFFEATFLKITFMGYVPESDKEFIAEADKAIKNFLSKNGIDRLELSTFVYKNCKDFLEIIEYDEIDKFVQEFHDKKKIWQYVYPQEIHIERRVRRDKDIYLTILCECEWEQEHGLQLVFRQGKQLTRVSDQDGHLTEADAYNKPDHQDELLHRFKV